MRKVTANSVSEKCKQWKNQLAKEDDLAKRLNILEGLYGYHLNRNNIQSAIPYLSQASDVAVRIAREQEAFEAKEHFYKQALGLKALECTKSGENILINTKDLLSEIIKMCESFGRYKSALYHYNTCIRSQDVKTRVWAFCGISECHIGIGERAETEEERKKCWQLALKMAKEAFLIEKTGENFQRVLKIQKVLYVDDVLDDRIRLQIENIQDASGIMTGDKWAIIGGIYQSLASLYVESQLYDKALDSYDCAIVYFAMAKKSTIIWDIYQSLASLYVESQLYDKALDSYDNAIKYFTCAKDIESVAIVEKEKLALVKMQAARPASPEQVVRAPLQTQAKEEVKETALMTPAGQILGWSKGFFDEFRRNISSKKADSSSLGCAN